MKSKKGGEPKAAQKKVVPAQPRRPVADAKQRPPRPVATPVARATEPKVTLYRHTTAPKYGDPQLDKIASDISHGIAKRRGEVIVPVASLTLALRSSKNVKWRNATPIQWCDAVLAFLLKNLAHRTKLLTFRAEGSTIAFKAVWRLPS